MSSSLSSSLKVLRCSPSNPDPAIDTKATLARDPKALAAYITERDPSSLVMAEGVTPEWFHLQRLPMAWLAQLDSIFPPSLQRILAFRAGCHMIETAEPLIVSCPGSKGVRWEATKADHGVNLAPEEWAQEVCDRFGADVVQEMGSLVIALSRLRRGARGPFAFWGGSVLSG